MKTPRAFSKTLFFMVLQKKKKKREKELTVPKKEDST